MPLRRGHVLIALVVMVVLPVLGIMSCEAPAPTATPKPPPTVPPPPTSTSPPPAPTAALLAPTAGPTLPQGLGQSLTMATTADFSGSGNCSLCHGLLLDESANDVSIDTHWRSTMMANAARDPYYLAKISSEIVHNPALAATIQEKCAVCHMPMAHTQAKVDGQPSAVLAPGFSDPKHPLHDVALDGVSCTVCHQVEDRGLGTKESFSGGFVIDTSTEPPHRKAYGPIPDPYTANMPAMVGYVPLLGEQVKKAQLCGVCHTLYTPYLDEKGAVAGEFPEQTPLLEWQHSAYAQMGMTCQSCHMPAAEGGAAISNRPNPPKIPLRSPFFQHHFVGGNVLMLNLYKAQVDNLGLACSVDNLDATLQRVSNQLQNRSIALSLADAEVAKDALSLVVRLENMAGHKFPAGFPSRRVWIHLKVTDASGAIVFESGQPRADGTIVGCDADDDAAAYEEHYDTISSPDQVQIYEPIMQDRNQKVTYTLLEAAGYLKDNRLLPRGFDKETAGDDYAVHGLAGVDKNFLGGADEVTYQISTAGHSGLFKVSVQVLYQTIGYGFIRDMQGYDTPLVKEFLGYYEEADRTPVIVAGVEQTIG